MRHLTILFLGLSLSAPAWADQAPIETSDTSEGEDSGTDDDEDDGGCFGGGKAALSLGLLMVYGLRKRR